MASISAQPCCSQLRLRVCPPRSNQPRSSLALKSLPIPNTKLYGLVIGPRSRTPSAGSDNIIINNNSNIIITGDNIIINNNNSNNNGGGGHGGHGGHGGNGGHGGHDDHDGGALDANRVWALKKAKEEPENMRRLMELPKLAMACGIGAGFVAKVIGATNGLIIARKDVVKEIEDNVEEIPVVPTPEKVENKEWSSYFQIKAKLLAALIPTESSKRGGPYKPAAMTKISAQLSRGSSGQSGKGGKA